MINRVGQTYDRAIPRTVAELVKQQRAMKTKQYIGGENMVYGVTNSEFAVFTVPAGGVIHVNAFVTPGDGRLQNWEMRMSYWIDIFGAGLDPTLLFPSGSALTAGQKKVLQHPLAAYITSDDSTGMRHNVVSFQNGDSVDHQVTALLIWYAILTEGTAT